MSEVSGPDRVREAIARDRGEYAPNRPVVLCGGDRTGTKTIRERDAASPLPRTSLAERLIVLIHCPACLRFRWNPGHWLTCGVSR